MTARYREIAAELREKIESGHYPPGGNLPGYGELTSAYGVGRGVVRSALSLLEADGLIQVVKKRGIIVRHGTMRLRTPRGTLVKRNVATSSPGYTFPPASGQEVWKHHIKPQASFEPLNDPRIAGLLGVPVGSRLMRRFRVTGPVSEPPFQINISWIHPRGVEDIPEMASQTPAPGDWLYRLERAGHWPISWTEIHRARMPTAEEAALLQIPSILPVLEIVRVGTSGGDGKPIEVTEYIVASDRVETVHVLHRDEPAQAPWPDDETNE
ncbi:GntR family transcriptional regulator [Spirillospora sp. NPDC048911]|uniref:GntR family transcriptional regulator n=1 Tax=Spirillospora sp. NPDC048911 TaxID=3364527 RepID=UPI00371D6786